MRKRIEVAITATTLLLLPTLASGEERAITMQLSFDCVKFEGDCGKIWVINPPDDQKQLHKTESGVSAEAALKGSEINDGVINLAPGELVFVKIAYVNDTNRHVRFRAIPHHVEPQNLQVVAIYQCMCLGETYTVPPHSAWYRILRVGAAFDMPAGSRFIATHILTSENLLPEAFAPAPHFHTHHDHH